MLEFYREQLKDVEERLKKLIRDRALAGIGVQGDYEIQINRLQEERARLVEEIKKEGGTLNAPSPAPATPSTKPRPAPPTEPGEATVKSLLSQGNLEAALELYHQQATGNEAILLMSRFRNIQKRQQLGTTTAEHYDMEIARITSALAELTS